MASILITPLITVVMAPGFSILGMTATSTRQFGCIIITQWIKIRSKNCVWCNQSLSRLHIFSNSLDSGHPSALKTDSIAGQVLIEHKANKEVYVTQSGDFII